MAELAIDRVLHGRPQQSWPQWASMLGMREGTAV
jgi:hypothetical protein